MQSISRNMSPCGTRYAAVPYVPRYTPLSSCRTAIPWPLGRAVQWAASSKPEFSTATGLVFEESAHRVSQRPGASTSQFAPNTAPDFGETPLRDEQERQLLWAGYSDISEQLRKTRAHHSRLSEAMESLQADVLKLRQQQQALQGTPLTAQAAWQAASFLLMFLVVINLTSFVVNLQAITGFPFWAAKPGAMTLFVKQALDVAVPFTNAAVVILFCVQAVKVAWTCLRW